ncbi:hypothetical protein L3081_23140 [Colwellia sp. MSW7]|uniref:HEAT repeat domain-containing protein n=1 Tax=Colwellia maritima TaxID=2912588 RepID=A0ABS9X686_9GAMM|nr:hypothetical protein [Colwellia maritima]MCI2285742.1 hypothetical protein [Colwellia maritima]
MKNIYQLILLSILTVTFPLAAKEQSDVTEFVQQMFVQGIPYEEASTYDSSNVITLKDMLRNPEYLQHWGKIAVMISIIGDESVVEDIIYFIENDPTGDFGKPHLLAKKNALFGLGYLINRTQNKTAEKYLTKGLEPAEWDKRGVLTLGRFSDSDTRNQYLSKASLLGLAISGSEDTLKAILKLEATDKKSSKFRGNIDHMLGDLIATNSEIKSRGLKKYYERRKH